MNINTQEAFNRGIAMGLAIHDKNHESFDYTRGFVEELDSDDVGGIHKAAAKLAVEFYKRAGCKDSFGFHLYDSLQNAEPWIPEYNDLVDPVIETLGRMTLELDHMNKAALEGSTVSNFFSGAANAAPATWQALLAMAATMGTGLGAANWVMQRNMVEDDEDAEKVQAQIDQYNRITQDINQGLARKGINP